MEPSVMRAKKLSLRSAACECSQATTRTWFDEVDTLLRSVFSQITQGAFLGFFPAINTKTRWYSIRASAWTKRSLRHLWSCPKSCPKASCFTGRRAHCF